MNLNTLDDYLLNTTAPSIKILHYTSRLLDVYLGIENTLQALSYPEVRDRIYSKMTADIDNLAYTFIDPVKAEKFGGFGAAKSEIDKGIPIVKESIRKKYLVEYPNVILNQGLVTLCTVFETYMNDTLWTVTGKRPQVLNQLSPRKELKLEEIIDLKSYEAILNAFQDKTIEHFSRQGIKKQFEDLEKIGILTDEVFNYSGCKLEIRQKYGTWGCGELEEIFQKRHDIVHKDKQPLSKIEELSEIEKFLEVLVWNMSFLFSRKFGILLDFLQFLIERGAIKSKEDIKDIFGKT